MSKFIIGKEVFQRLPNACFGAVIAKGIDNSKENASIGQLLDSELADIRKRLDGVNLKDYPPISFYRAAFQAIGINPNRYANSVEALCKRVLGGSPFPQINPIVDIGNAMSLKYILPMGAHDIDKLNGGDLSVRFGMGGDTFVPFGEDTSEAVPEGELIYVTGHTVKTRRWIWRQSENGKIDLTSSNVIYPIDGFIGQNDENIHHAMADLSTYLKHFLNCEIVTGFLTAENNYIEL